MIVYIIAFVLVLIGCQYNHRMAPSLRMFYMGVILVYIVLLMGLRFRVGMDTINYMSAYTRSTTWDQIWKYDLFEQRFEPGYTLICAFCKSFTNQFWPVQLICATLGNGLIFIFLYQRCKNPFVGVLIFFILQWLYFTTEIMRESIAIGIFLLNFSNIEKKNWLRYYLFSLLSIVFHYSAVIVLLMPLVRFLKLNWIYIAVCCILIFSTPLFENVSAIVNSPMLYSRIDGAVQTADKYNFNWRIAEAIKTALIPITVLIIARRCKYQIPIKNMLLLQLFFCCGAFAIPIIFSRFTNYTTLFVTVSVANLLTIRSVKRDLKIILVAMILLSQSYYYIGMRKAWIPYVSVLDPYMVPERETMWWEQFH